MQDSDENRMASPQKSCTFGVLIIFDCEMKIENLVKQEVIKVDPNAEVILFGSRARGDFRKDSDWDFLVLLDRPLTPGLKSLILDNLYYLELEYNSIISAIIHSKSEWEELAVTPIYQIIKKEGKQA